MKILIQFAVINCVLTASALASSLGPNVVYGEDSRHEVYEASAVNQVLAKSTAAMIAVADIDPIASTEVIKLNQHTLTD